MTKEAFIARLEAGLAGLPAPSREEVLRDIDDHFTEGLRHGLTEEEISARLGSPEELARALLEEGRLDTLAAPAQEGDPFRKEEKAGEDSFDAFASSLADLVDRLCRRFTSAGESEGTPFRQLSSFALPLDRVEVRLGSADLRILPGGGDSVVCQTEKEDTSLRFEVRDRVLHIWQEGAAGRLSLSFLKVSVDTGERLTLSLPDTPPLLDVHTGSGDIEAENVPLRKAALVSASGDITLSLSRPESLECRTASGDIEAEAEAFGPLTLSSTSGDICLKAREGRDRVKVETVSGDVEADLQSLEGALELSTVSGDIEAGIRALAGPVTVHSVSGDQELTLPEAPVKAALSTRSGDARIRGGGKDQKGTSLTRGTGAFPCAMTSVSGDLTLHLL